MDQLRDVVTNMLNENRAAVDLEKLDEQEFNLDEKEMAEFRQRESDLVSSIQARVWHDNVKTFDKQDNFLPPPIKNLILPSKH